MCNDLEKLASKRELRDNEDVCTKRRCHASPSPTVPQRSNIIEVGSVWHTLINEFGPCKQLPPIWNPNYTELFGCSYKLRRFSKNPSIPKCTKDERWIVTRIRRLGMAVPKNSALFELVQSFGFEDYMPKLSLYCTGFKKINLNLDGLFINELDQSLIIHANLESIESYLSKATMPHGTKRDRRSVAARERRDRLRSEETHDIKALRRQQKDYWPYLMALMVAGAQVLHDRRTAMVCNNGDSRQRRKLRRETGTSFKVHLVAVPNLQPVAVFVYSAVISWEFLRKLKQSMKASESCPIVVPYWIISTANSDRFIARLKEVLAPAPHKSAASSSHDKSNCAEEAHQD